jgi:aspartate-semialdehyde dehydrogenase
MTRAIDVGILGATGMVGQQFIALLSDHPWFRVTWLGASQRSEGKRYLDACAWRLAARLPDAVAGLTVESAQPGSAPKLLFSALDANVAGDIEAAFAQAGHTIVSNARNFRMDPVVPLLVPEVNDDQLGLLPAQAAAKGWPGRIVTNPNCSTVVLTMALAPLRQFGLKSAMVTTLQAISGAGYPGVASWDILGNVIPFISGEEEKIESEPKKILGCTRNGRVEPHEVAISAQTTRVAVQDGHTVTVSVAFEHKPAIEDVLNAIRTFRGRPQALDLPSAPAEPLTYREEPNRPQPRLDADRGRGMTVSVGRLRPCPLFHYKFVTLGHNTIRGAAGAAILNAEMMNADGLL